MAAQRAARRLLRLFFKPDIVETHVGVDVGQRRPPFDRRGVGRAVTHPCQIDVVVCLQELHLEFTDEVLALGGIPLARLRLKDLIDFIVLPAAVVTAAVAGVALAENLVGPCAAEADRVHDQLELAFVLLREEGGRVLKALAAPTRDPPPPDLPDLAES